MLTLLKRIELLASTNSVKRTPRKIQSTRLTPSITAPGKLVIHIYLRTGHITRVLFVLLTSSRLMLNKKSSQFQVSSPAQSPACSASALPLGGVARSAENRDDYDSLSFDGEVDGVGKSAS